MRKRRTRKRTAPRKPPPTIITLYDIQVEEILKDYYGPGEDSPSESDDGISETVLKFGDELDITELLHEKSKKSKNNIVFVDPQKSTVKMWGNMFDVANNGALPRYTTKPCWWCRSPFDSHPIGCPIRYISSDTEPNRSQLLERLKEANLPLDCGTDYFETEGVFCTFPCVKAYILDQISRTKSPKYKRALTLLTLLYKKLYNTIALIPTAATWKVLIDWGGHLSPQEYRAATGLLEYEETINTRRPYMYSVSSYVQEKRLQV